MRGLHGTGDISWESDFEFNNTSYPMVCRYLVATLTGRRLRYSKLLLNLCTNLQHRDTGGAREDAFRLSTKLLDGDASHVLEKEALVLSNQRAQHVDVIVD